MDGARRKGLLCTHLDPDGRADILVLRARTHRASAAMGLATKVPSLLIHLLIYLYVLLGLTEVLAEVVERLTDGE